MISYGHDYTKYVLNSAGPELAFARTLLSAGVSTRIGFLPHAMGGYSVYRCEGVAASRSARCVCVCACGACAQCSRPSSPWMDLEASWPHPCVLHVLWPLCGPSL